MSASVTKPNWSITPSFDNVPFQEIPGIWLNWRALPSKHGKKPRKDSFQPNHPNQHVKVNDISHCGDFDAAQLSCELNPKKIEGIGINLYTLAPDKHPMTALDLDNCFELTTNTLEPWVVMRDLYRQAGRELCEQARINPHTTKRYQMSTSTHR